MERERMKREEENEERERENNDVSARWQPSGGWKNKKCHLSGNAEVAPVFEPSKKVVPLFEHEKRSCQYLIITLKVVPLYDVNPFLTGTTCNGYDRLIPGRRRPTLRRKIINWLCRQRNVASAPPKGHLAVYVCREGVDPLLYRVVLPIIFFNHPLIRGASRRISRRIRVWSIWGNLHSSDLF